MRRALAFILLIPVLLTASPVFADSVASFLKQAEDAWQHRDQTGKTEDAIGYWQEVLNADPGRVDLYIRLTQACSRAHRRSPSPSKRLHYADIARRYGALAVAKNPAAPAAYARYAEALGQWAQADKGLHSLHFVKEAMRNLDKALALDPHYAFAHMLLARFYLDAPPWVFIGNKTKALEHAKLAVEDGPGYAINHLTLAKVYREIGRKEEARAELKKTLAVSPPADAVPETAADQADAQEMLKQL